jgi:hypothetical protein
MLSQVMLAIVLREVPNLKLQTDAHKYSPFASLATMVTLNAFEAWRSNSSLPVQLNNKILINLRRGFAGRLVP